MKKIITVAEIPAVKAVIRECRKYDLMSMAQIAGHTVAGESCEILKADAEVSRNNFVYNFYSDESGEIDIQLTVYAFNRQKGLYIISAFLSDIVTLPPKELFKWMEFEEYKPTRR